MQMHCYPARHELIHHELIQHFFTNLTRHVEFDASHRQWRCTTTAHDPLLSVQPSQPSSQATSQPASQPASQTDRQTDRQTDGELKVLMGISAYSKTNDPSTSELPPRFQHSVIHINFLSVQLPQRFQKGAKLGSGAFGEVVRLQDCNGRNLPFAMKKVVCNKQVILSLPSLDKSAP